MNQTSINILSQKGQFKYIVKYDKETSYEDLSEGNYFYELNNRVLTEPTRIDFYDPNVNLRRDKNSWSVYKPLIENRRTEYLPQEITISTLTIYFPQFSVETYSNNTKYALTVNTWIHGHAIYLGTYLIDRKDAIASDKIETFGNQQYYECTTIDIIDPWYIVYSDDWKDFRQNVCGEEEYDSKEINNTGSLINISLHPIVLDGSNYLKLDNYIGGQNSISLEDSGESLHLHLELSQGNATQLQLTLSFNQAYDQTYKGLLEYIEETYGLKDVYTDYECVLKDSENIYKAFVNIKQQVEGIAFSRNGWFDSWNDYLEGMRFIASFNVYSDSTKQNLILSILSNEIPVIYEVAKFFIGVNIYGEGDDSKEINHINLKVIDMKVNNLNVVNKIEKNIVKVERPNDAKSNIVKPVYFRARDLANLVIHPLVTENICINLDAYKSQVDSFLINIEGCIFYEIGRNQSGVLFKVVGSNLPNQLTSGVYYVLNQDQELITTGKYTYEL